MSEQLVVFALNKEEYALLVSAVREIARLEEITHVPDTPPYIKGIISLRGKAIPVIDIHQRLGLHRSHCNVALVAEVDGITLGLAVNEVKEVSVLGEVQPAPPLVNTQMIEGIINLPNRLIMVLKLESIVGLEEQQQLEKMVG